MRGTGVRTSMTLRGTYRILAPVYDAVVRRASHAARARSLARLRAARDDTVLLAGVGTGLDLALLPQGPRYLGLDASRAMLARARARCGSLDIALIEGDAQCLPFPDAHFDAVILHLIVAVVPSPERCLAEAARVVRPHGQVLVFDKFLRPHERGWLRRAVNPLARRVATRTDVVFEAVLAQTPALFVRDDRPALAGGWFRLIELERRPS